MQELIDQFQIITEAGGRYNVNVYAEVVLTTHLRSGGHTTQHGRLHEYVTDEGHHLNALDDGSFEIVELGVIGLKVEG